ncbi:MAG: hypothetical protein ACR2H3_02905 [Acidimicrobiales bacterium]
MRRNELFRNLATAAAAVSTMALLVALAEVAVRTRAGYLITSDPADMTALIDRGGGTAHVVPL